MIRIKRRYKTRFIIFKLKNNKVIVAGIEKFKIFTYLVLCPEPEKRIVFSYSYKRLIIIEYIYIFQLFVPFYRICMIGGIIAVMAVYVNFVWLFPLRKKPRL